MTVQFKSWLRWARRALRITQKALGKEAGISAGRVSDFETGRKLPTVDEAAALMGALQRIRERKKQ